MPGGSAWPKNIFQAAKQQGRFVWSPRGSGGMLPWKIFKVKCLRFAKNAFPKILAWKNWIKISQHITLLLNLGVLKNCLLAFGGGGIAPLGPAIKVLCTTGEWNPPPCIIHLFVGLEQ